MKIHLENLVYNPAFNKREIDLAHVNVLAEQIARYGLLTALTVRKGGKVDGVQTFIVAAGFHRYKAIEKLQGLSEAAIRKLGEHTVDGKVIPGRTFDEIFHEDKIECIVIDSDVADAAVIVENTARKDYTQPELYVLVVELHDAGVDQHEIASRCTMNQGRVSEYLSLQKCIPQAHDAWIDGHLTMRDMLALATLPEDKQKTHLEKLSTAGIGEAKTTKEGRQAKASARKELLGDAKETRRGYANAGKPSRKRIATLSERVEKASHSGDEATKNVMSIVSHTLKFLDGKLSEKDYAKWLGRYAVSDVFTDPVVEKPKAEKAGKAKPEKKPRAEKPKAEKKAKPAKASKPKAEKKAKPKAEKKAKPNKAAKSVKKAA